MELETREYTAQTGRIIKAAQSGRLQKNDDNRKTQDRPRGGGLWFYES